MILCVILGLLVKMLLPKSKKKSFINSWYAFFLFLGVTCDIKNMSFINEAVGKLGVVLLYQKYGQLLQLSTD